MIAGIDNGLVFGSMANLRLAPHVREGRNGSRVPATGSVQSERVGAVQGEARATGPQPFDSRSLFVEGERLDISAEARAAFESQLEVDSSTTQDVDRAEQQELRELETRDAEVRAHEHAHLAAAGGLALSGASFTTERGPDGKSYAVAGEVQIDVSEVPGDPQATLSKASRIRAAALAPANPSSADRAVAQQAAAMAAQARVELSAERRDESADESATDPLGGAGFATQAYAVSDATEPSANAPSSLFADLYA